MAEFLVFLRISDSRFESFRRGSRFFVSNNLTCFLIAVGPVKTQNAN